MSFETKAKRSLHEGPRMGWHGDGPLSSLDEDDGFKHRRSLSSISSFQLAGLALSTGHLAPFRQD